MSTKSSPAIPPSRQMVVAKFIEDLHDLKNLFPKTPDELLQLSTIWEVLISQIENKYLRGRQADSFFSACASKGLTTAEEVWNLWVATTGGEQVIEQRRQILRAEYRDAEAQDEPIGPARQRMRDYLYRHNITEESLGQVLR